MTDIELLPLPKKAQLANPYAGRGIPTYGHSDETLTDYARAVAEHNVRFLTHELANAECVIDAEQAGRKKAEAEIAQLRSANEALRAEVEALKRHVTLLSNIAYNLAQDDRLSDSVRWSLDDSRKKWDTAIHPAAAQEGK